MTSFMPLNRRPAAIVEGKRIALALMLCLVAMLPATAAVPTKPSVRAEVRGDPIALQVQPASVDLNGPRAMQQIVVSGRYADGSVRDLTPFCELSLDADNVVNLGALGFLLPKGNGTTNIVVKAGKQTAKVP